MTFRGTRQFCVGVVATIFTILSLTSISHAVQYQGSVLYKLVLPAGSSSLQSMYDPRIGSGGISVYASDFQSPIHDEATIWDTVHPNGLVLPPPLGYKNSTGFFSSNGKIYGRVERNDGSLFGAIWSGPNYSNLQIVQLPGDPYIEFTNEKNGQLVGGGNGHAVIYNSDNTLTDLHPAGTYFTALFSTDGAHQVGRVDTANGSLPHAAVWNGTSSSFVDLHPSGYSQSWALAVSGDQQAGFARDSISNSNHAMIWSGTAGSAKDLNPTGSIGSIIRDTNGSMQVGSAAITNGAIAWFGSANDYINLNALLPSAYSLDGSWADFIDTNGDIYGFASDHAGDYYAVQWTAVVPEPGAAVILPAILSQLVRRKRFWR